MNLAECVTKTKFDFMFSPNTGKSCYALHHKYLTFRSVIIGILTKQKMYGFFVAALQLINPDEIDKKYIQICHLNLSIF